MTDVPTCLTRSDKRRLLRSAPSSPAQARETHPPRWLLTCSTTRSRSSQRSSAGILWTPHVRPPSPARPTLRGREPPHLVRDAVCRATCTGARVAREVIIGWGGDGPGRPGAGCSRITTARPAVRTRARVISSSQRRRPQPASARSAPCARGAAGRRAASGAAAWSTPSNGESRWRARFHVSLHAAAPRCPRHKAAFPLAPSEGRLLTSAPAAPRAQIRAPHRVGGSCRWAATRSVGPA